ncbi:hypothetical protein IGM_06299 [Bacillus cereus HuB4-4]|uniref:Uncharacterized protein n=1 Tax=Bacillus cereus HuB4-4 TaxID=1053211 RepID=A0A9W5QNA7_BACCE|nr:hypothetical protein IGM_06299 [Bacillus cereus HuB4-4]
MSKKVFTEKEIQILSSNPYVKAVSAKGIIYTDEFKRIFIVENQNEKFPREIFEECGFDIDIIGMHRIHSAAKRWRATYKNEGVMGLRDTRTENSGKSGEKVH